MLRPVWLSIWGAKSHTKKIRPEDGDGFSDHAELFHKPRLAPDIYTWSWRWVGGNSRLIRIRAVWSRFWAPQPRKRTGISKTSDKEYGWAPRSSVPTPERPVAVSCESGQDETDSIKEVLLRPPLRELEDCKAFSVKEVVLGVSNC